MTKTYDQKTSATLPRLRLLQAIHLQLQSDSSPTHQTHPPTIPFTWTSEAEEAFNWLKELFTSAPILIQPDPSRQLVVEVDVSDSGVGAVLSQHSNPDQKLHSCAFFSRHLFPTEHNYNVGNRELLTIKLALEEWRH